MNNLLVAAVAGLIMASAVSAAEPTPGSQTAQSFTGSAGTMNYWLWLPKETPAEGAPVLVFLHGAGERGDDLAMVKKHGPPKLVDSLAALQPFIIISPQCPKEQRWSVGLVKQLVDHVVEKRQGDRTRVYITGLSMGGFGTWEITVQYPDFFAAAVPICGRGDPSQAAKIKDLPIRVFHGAKDEAVPLASSQEMVDALKAAGAEDVEFTVYPDLAHDSWTPTYADPKLYEWLLTKQRK
ncbi:MAG: prolyl oligopeptidase family serine peptidase [Verrucomicrobiales bacterium]